MAGSRRPDLAITGVAIANCLGSDPDEVYGRAFAGTDCFRPASEYFEFPFTTLLGIMPGADDLTAPTRLGRVALASARQLAPAVAAAVERWGARRVAYVFASSTGGLEQTERYLAPHAAFAPVAYRFADHGVDARRDLAALLGVEGLRSAVATACSSSLNALATAARFIEHGLADAAVVGSADSLCRTTVFGFHSLGLLAPTATRPFAEDRQGITLGEGSAFILLEREGGDARPLARVAGLGASSDAFHQTSPHPDGAGAEACMRQALARAGLDTRDVDLVAAHATGTRQNDAVEGAALARMFGPSVPVTASKSLTGHTLGASGLTALVLAVEALRRQALPPTLRADPMDPGLAPLALVHAPAPARLRHVLVNAFGFGGSNASAVVAA